jgi:hypothetical protein
MLSAQSANYTRVGDVQYIHSWSKTVTVKPGTVENAIILCEKGETAVSGGYMSFRGNGEAGMPQTMDGIS